MAAGALLLAGCGGGGFADESASTILDAAEKDMKALSAMTMTGELTTDGQQLGLDMSLTTDGDCKGTMEIDGGSAQILSVGGESWLKADSGFWDATAGGDSSQVQAIVGDKWVVMPPGEGSFAEVCDLDTLREEMGDENEGDGEVGETEEVDGQDAVTVDTETDEGDPLRVWVAVDEPHHVLQLEVTEGGEPGTITFSDFDKDLEIAAPSEDEVIDLSQLGG